MKQFFICFIQEALCRVEVVVAEAVPAFVVEDDIGGIFGVDRFFEFGEALVDEGLGAVLVLSVVHFVGGFEDFEVGVQAEELGGGGLDFFGADVVHLLVVAAA